MGNSDNKTIVCFNSVDVGSYDYNGFSQKPKDIDFSDPSCQLSSEGQFDVNVDWDIDLTEAEGCHGTDLFFQDDPIKLKFAVFSNSDILVRGIGHYRILLTSNNELFLVNPAVAFSPAYNLDPLHHLPVHYETTGGGGFDMYKQTFWKAYALNAAFRQCIEESNDLNTHLTAQQKSVVERFFAAVRTAFPQEFAAKIQK